LAKLRDSRASAAAVQTAAGQGPIFPLNVACGVSQSFGASVFSDLQVEETLLVQDGRCMARSYRTCDYFAMWLIEVGLLQFFNAEGDVLLVLNLLEDSAPGKVAA
jgi:hypothetical protein